MQLNVLIADDHPIFLNGLKEAIEADKELRVAAIANNGQSAVSAFESNKNLDVVVMDVDMPRMNGLEAAENMLKIRPHIPIIILTMHNDKSLFMKAMDIGIMGYLLKENTAREVISAIYKVTEGSSYLSPELSFHLVRRNKPGPDISNPIDQLTMSEKKILKLVAEYKSSQEIADLLFISEKTVFNHRMNISRKLNLNGKNSLLRFAIENISNLNY